MTVPACVNPLLLAMGGDPLDEYGKIERSVRLRSSASAYLTRTPGSAGNRKTWTWGGWVKRAGFGSTQVLFEASTDTNNRTHLRFAPGDTIEVLSGTAGVTEFDRVTADVFRDPSSHMQVHWVMDTDNAVAEDRCRLYINNRRVTSFSPNTNPSAGYVGSKVNAAAQHFIGFGNFAGQYLNGYVSGVYFVDGMALEPAAFGLFHPRTGQWRPKSKAAIRAAVAAAGGTVRNGWGANGFFLPFDDPTSLTTLGYDRSQSDTDTTGNNWTSPNISLTAGTTYDSLLDTPTNDFATLNPLLHPYVNLSDGNLKSYANDNDGLKHHVQSTLGTGAGRLYWEVEVNSNFYKEGGFVDPQGEVFLGFTNEKFNTNHNTSVIYSINGFAWQRNGDVSINGSTTNYPTYTYVSSSTTKFALDVNAKKMWIGTVVAGWYNGDPAALTGGFDVSALFSAATTVFPAGMQYSTGTGSGSTTSAYTGALWFNFGQRTFAASVPAGFKSLCTKNLPFPKITNPKSAFVAVTDTGAAIAATLAAARSGWPDYIDIIKRRDPTAEGWRWIFSDDPTNYLDSSSTAAKAAVPSISGTAYVGYSLKVSPANGVATGRLTHVAGTADTVVDGLANSRKMVILKNEATGSWYVYHPDLTAGKLLYLEQQSAETADTTISSVTASGFTIAAELASGVYRWVALSEIGGVLKLGKYTGNVSADGPFQQCGMTPALICIKSTSSGRAWYVQDSAVAPYNPECRYLEFENSAGDTSVPAGILDKNSSGFKIRTALTGWNAAETHVFFSIAAYPFRYANAR